MRPREWVAVHRRHHASTDTSDDPHSPAVVGFWRVQLGNVGLYRRSPTTTSTRASTRATSRRIGSTGSSSTTRVLGLGVGITILVVMMYGARVRAVGRLPRGRAPRGAYVMLSGAINAVGHTLRRQPYENSATNGQSLALVTGGEGLHNNHHAAPTSAGSR